MPFPERITDVDEVTTSNVINQIVFSTLFLVSGLCLIPKRKMLAQLLAKEKFLTLFLSWCLLSILWSEFGVVSFKRLFQIFTTVTVSLALLLHTDSSDQPLRYFKSILYLYIPLTLLSIIFVPGAIDPDSSTWRGLAPGKNHLGQAAMISTIIWFFAVRSATGARKFFLSCMLVISIILLFGAKSMTSLLALASLAALGAILSIDEIFKPLNIGRIFSFVVMLSLVGIILSTIYFAPELMRTMPEYVDRNITFTGRTDLWADVFEETKKNWLHGCGFSGFWVIGNPPVMDLYEEYVWLPKQAHMGYLDIWNETGLVGLLLFAGMIIFYFKNLTRLEKPHLWKWFLIATLMINLQETTLFRQNILSGVMFIFSYLALYAELGRVENHKLELQPGANLPKQGGPDPVF